MTRYHFFPDTNFFIDFPDFHDQDQFLFDDKPFIVVICRPVLFELDRLKRDNSVGFQARQASRTMESLFSGEVRLPSEGQLIRYDRRVYIPGMSFDEQIELTAKQYAEDLKGKSMKVVLLTSDRNLRNLAKSEVLDVADPHQWYKAKLEERQRQVERPRLDRQSLDRLRSLLDEWGTQGEHETGGLEQLKTSTADTLFHIDYDWWERKGLRLGVELRAHLCQEHRAVFSIDKIDWVDEKSGEGAQVGGLRHVLQVHCSKQPDYINDNLLLVDAVFRVFLANGNTPLTCRELGSIIGRPTERVLRTLGGRRVYKGIRPVQKV